MIRRAGEADMGRLNAALARLSEDLGDAHAARTEAVEAACLGPHPACHGLLAEEGAQVVAAALLSPVFSTVRGGAGTYVSDLWVAPERRGAGLGRRMLGAAARLGHRLWRGRFLKLAVYEGSAAARAFYTGLGFREVTEERVMVLDASEYSRLERAP